MWGWSTDTELLIIVIKKCLLEVIVLIVALAVDFALGWERLTAVGAAVGLFSHLVTELFGRTLRWADGLCWGEVKKMG